MRTASTGRDVLSRAVRGQLRLVVPASLLAAGHQGGEALIPVVVGIVIDQAVANGDLPSLLGWLGALGVIFLALSTCYRWAARTSERAAEQAAHRIRIDLSARVLDPQGGAEAGHLPGELVNVATEDARRVGIVNSALPFGFAAVLGVLVSAVALLRMSVPLGLLVLLAAPPMLWLTHLIGKPLERRSGLEQQRAAKASGVASDLVAGLRVLKGIGAEDAAIIRYRRTSQESLAATIRSATAHAWHDGAILALTGAFIALVALVGGHLAAAGAISIGDLVAAVGLAQFLLGPLAVFTHVNGALAQGRASAARVAGVLAAAPAVRAGSTALPEHPKGRLSLRAVRHDALPTLDVRVEPGELVGIVASDQTAAGALLDCLARETEPRSGSIELDGVALSELAPNDVRSVLLVAAHEADLFEGTVLDNVAAGRAATDVAAALAASGADEVASGLPDGVHTEVAERGRSLSGGQRQRVALARALAADPPVLVVHDPTTAVDTVTEARIAKQVRQVRSGRTTILVTTSPALLAETDRVLVIEPDGVTEGGHLDLVQNERYRSAVLA